jgi:hypothetical protein
MKGARILLIARHLTCATFDDAVLVHFSTKLIAVFTIRLPVIYSLLLHHPFTLEMSPTNNNTTKSTLYISIHHFNFCCSCLLFLYLYVYVYVARVKDGVCKLTTLRIIIFIINNNNNETFVQYQQQQTTTSFLHSFHPTHKQVGTSFKNKA